MYHLPTTLYLRLHPTLGRAMQLVFLGLMGLSICRSPTREVPTLNLKPLIITMIKGMAIMTEVTVVDGVGTLTPVGEVEAEAEVTTINASLWIQVGLVLGIEVAGMDHPEDEEVGLEL
jgi:hypothetical protein